MKKRRSALVLIVDLGGRAKFMFALLALLSITAAGLAQTTSEKLDSYCEAITKSGFSGTVLVSRGGEVLLHKGYGAADRDKGVVNGPDTLFEIASLSKQFTAAAILKLEEAGKLSTDDPIHKHLPGVPDAYRDVTIYHLLTQTGGVPGGGSGRGMDLEKAVGLFLGTPPLSKPGTRYAYSNVGYALLAGIVDVASGTSLESYCREVLFTPSGMKNAGFCGETFSDAELALGYSGSTGAGRPTQLDPYPPYDEFGYEYRGMGGVVMSTADLHRWYKALQGDTVLSRDLKTKLFTPFLGSYACGWEVFTFPDGRRCVGHGGGVRGFVCKLWMFPDDQSVLAVLSNRDDFQYHWLNDLYNILFDIPVAQNPNRRPQRRLPAPRQLPKVVPAEEAELLRLVGNYTSQGEAALQLSVEREAGGVIARIEPPEKQIADDAFEAARTLADQILSGLKDGDVSVIADNLAPGIPPTWPDTIKTVIWPGHLENRGALLEHTVLGAEQHSVIRGVTTVWLRLEHANGVSAAMIGIRDQKLQLLILDVSDFYCPRGPQGVYHKREDGSFLAKHDGRMTSTISVTGEGEVTLQRGGLKLTFHH